MKYLTTILALICALVLASPTPQGKTDNVTSLAIQGVSSTFCGYCNFQGVGQDLVTTTPKCTPLYKLGGSSVGTCVNLNCQVCMFYKDRECKDTSFDWYYAPSPYFSAYKYNSYACAA